MNAFYIYFNFCLFSFSLSLSLSVSPSLILPLSSSRSSARTNFPTLDLLRRYRRLNNRLLFILTLSSLLSALLRFMMESKCFCVLAYAMLNLKPIVTVNRFCAILVFNIPRGYLRIDTHIHIVNEIQKKIRETIRPEN